MTMDPTRVPTTSEDDQDFVVPPHCIAKVKLTRRPRDSASPGRSMRRASSLVVICTGLMASGVRKWKIIRTRAAPPMGRFR